MLSRQVFNSFSKTFQTSIRAFGAKDIKFGSEARALMMDGCDRITDAVQVTLGPKGRNVIIDQTFGSPKITKDGVTVAQSISFSEKFENMGAQLVKSVAEKANNQAGDGTTTASILTRAIFREGCKSVAAGMNPMDLRRGINHAVDHVVKNLKESSKVVNGKDQIANVATISANNDAELGNLIAELFEKVGNTGAITVEEGKTLHHEIEFVEGMKFDRGYQSPYFATNTKNQVCELENPMILLANHKVNNLQAILKHLEFSMQQNRPLLIISEEVESEPLTALILNRLKGNLRICCVKSPAFGDNRKNQMQDIAILTNAQVIDNDVGLTFENAETDVLGGAKRVIVTKDDCTIIDGAGDKELIHKRVDTINGNRDASTSDYDREKLSERSAKLSGGVGVIKVGGATEVEVKEVKDRIDDALQATRCAIDEGIVVGGGCALLYAAQSLKDLKGANFDQSVGIDIVRKALETPAKTIVNNAGVEGSVIIGKLLELNDLAMGYDAYNDKIVNMTEAGIIDPTKVVRTALIDAASVASLMITTEAAIVDLPEEKGAANPMAGMGGMGGMPGMM